MTSFLKKAFWTAALAALAYAGYQHAPSWARAPDVSVEELVGVPSSSAAEADARTLSTTCVDVNSAGYQELQRIRYVNPIRAKTIMELRMDRPFRDLGDLVRVRGIGSHRVDAIRRQGVACLGEWAT